MKKQGGRFDIYDDGTRLSAVLDLPADFDESRGCPVCIVIHGFTAHKDEPQMDTLAEAVTEAGCASLRVDMYGHGKSDGSFRDHTLLKWISNAMAVIDYAKGLGWATDLYLCGHSQGGLLVMLTGAIERDCVKGMILLAPGTVIPDGARKGYFPVGTDKPEIVPDVFPVWDRELSGNYVRVAKMINLDDFINAYKGPVLVIQGEADDVVLPETTIAEAEKYSDFRLVMIPGETHAFDVHPELAQAEIKAWLRGQTSLN